jgi:uncharacterized protein (TIGR03546 family)
MLIIIKAIKSLLGVLHSSDSPWQVAFGAALGALIGLNPLSTLQAAVLFLVLMATQSNLGAAALATALFALLGFLLDPVAHGLGYALLVQAPSLTPLWTDWYNAPLVPFTRFYNTVVLGSFLLGLVLFVPVLLGTRQGVIYYRKNLQARIEKLKVAKLLNLSKLLDLWEKKHSQ